MNSDIPRYTLEQIINQEQEMTCVTTDRTQYKGILLHMYRNLDCMLGNIQVKYLDKRIEQREAAFIRGTKIIFFILPESVLPIIVAKVEEELAKEEKARKSSKGKGQPKEKNPPKTNKYPPTNQEDTPPKQNTVPVTITYDNPVEKDKPSKLNYNATAWQPLPVYQPYQQQSQFMYGYSAVPTGELYVQQYAYPYQSFQMAPPMSTPMVQPHPTQQPQNYQMQQPTCFSSGGTVYYPPQYQPAYFMPQQAYQQPYLSEQQHSGTDFRVLVQVPPFQVPQEPQYPHPNVQMQQQMQHPFSTAPVQTYQPTRSLPTQQVQDSNPNEAYAPTRSFQNK